MLYPAFPKRQNNFSEYEPQLPHDELIAIFEKYSDLGLYIVPKYRNRKFPHWYFWKDDNKTVKRSKQDSLAYQNDQSTNGWCVITGEKSNRVVVVDIDPQEIITNGDLPTRVYQHIQGLSSTKFVLGTPSYGVHMYYRVPEDLEMIGNISPPIAGVDLRAEGGQVVFIGGFNRYTGNKAEAKGVIDGHSATYTTLEGGEYDSIPEMSTALYEWLKTNHSVAKTTVKEAKDFAKTVRGSARLSQHLKQPLPKQENMVRQALMAILANWGGSRDYDEWYQVWMSAHHGSNGSDAIMNILLDHPQVYWKAEADKADFMDKWHKHTHKESGHSVASLYYLASKAGWMKYTDYEIKNADINFTQKFVQDWIDSLEDIPNRLMLQSQTGSGKTYSIKFLWESQGKPKAVIFVPTRKLATELTQSLKNQHNLPVVCYRDVQTGMIIDTKEMSEAQILVTTLQSFSNRLGENMVSYGMVYFEESDQLLQQFARGGDNSEFRSHVTHKQAESGYNVVKNALHHSKLVWFVDATMSMVTKTVVDKLSHDKVPFARNNHISKKSPVTILTQPEDALKQILDGVVYGKKTVVVCDTAGEAEIIYKMLESKLKLFGRKGILIIGKTGENNKVNEFMSDVNRGADLYDLIVYNSVMASGVSITDVTPDVTVQFCTYLTPRVNLQLLNRFRSQGEVYVYYHSVERLFSDNSDELIGKFDSRALLESQLAKIPLAERTEITKIRLLAATVSIADETAQKRLPIEFYKRLLEDDGRVVTIVESAEYLEQIETQYKNAKDRRNDEIESIKSTWHEVTPIDPKLPVDPNLSAVEVAKGLIHFEIIQSLGGVLPSLTKYEPSYIYDVVKHFNKYAFLLHAFIDQKMVVDRAEKLLIDKARILTDIRANVATIKLLSYLTALFDNLGQELLDDVLEQRCDAFMGNLTMAKEVYDIAINRTNQKFDVVYERKDDNADRAIAFAKILLSKIGLKLRVGKKQIDNTKHKVYSVVNLNEAQDYLTWKDRATELELQFDTLNSMLDSNGEIMSRFNALPKQNQEMILGMVDQHNTLEHLVAMLGE